MANAVLSNETLRCRLSELLIHADEDRVEPCSYDMRVGTLFPIDGDVTDPLPERVRVRPGDFIRLFTLEELTLPPDLCCTAFALNKRSAEGLLVLNPGHVDPGFNGPLMVTAWNLSGQDQILEKGDRILKVIFHPVDCPGTPFSGNEDRPTRERKFRKKSLVTGARGLSQLLESNNDSRIAAEDDLVELRQQMTNTLSTRMSFFVAMVSLVIAVSALVVSIAPLAKQFTN